MDSGSTYPGTAVKQLNAMGIPWEKLVIGKPMASGEAETGYIEPATLANCISQVKELGGQTNIMFWQWSAEAVSQSYQGLLSMLADRRTTSKFSAP